MSKKYKLAGEVMEYEGVILYRIRALKDFGDVKKGDFGGWIQFEKNLSQEGLCWVSGDAKVYGNAEVYDNAKVYGNAEIYGNAEVYDNAEVSDSAIVRDNAEVYKHATVYEHAIISMSAEVSGYARVYGHARITEVAHVCGKAEIWGDAFITDDAIVRGQASICSDSYITDSCEYLIVGPVGSRADFTTFSKSKTSINVVCGCFAGTIDAFEQRVDDTHRDSFHYRDYMNAIKFAKSLLTQGK